MLTFLPIVLDVRFAPLSAGTTFPHADGAERHGQFLHGRFSQRRLDVRSYSKRSHFCYAHASSKRSASTLLSSSYFGSRSGLRRKVQNVGYSLEIPFVVMAGTKLKKSVFTKRRTPPSSDIPKKQSFAWSWSSTFEVAGDLFSKLHAMQGATVGVMRFFRDFYLRSRLSSGVHKTLPSSIEQHSHAVDAAACIAEVSDREHQHEWEVPFVEEGVDAHIVTDMIDVALDEEEKEEVEDRFSDLTEVKKERVIVAEGERRAPLLEEDEDMNNGGEQVPEGLDKRRRRGTSLEEKTVTEGRSMAGDSSPRVAGGDSIVSVTCDINAKESMLQRTLTFLTDMVSSVASKSSSANNAPSAQLKDEKEASVPFPAEEIPASASAAVASVKVEPGQAEKYTKSAQGVSVAGLIVQARVLLHKFEVARASMLSSMDKANISSKKTGAAEKDLQDLSASLQDMQEKALSLFVAMAQSTDPDHQPRRVAAAALAALALETDTNRQAIEKFGGVAPLINLLKSNDPETQIQAAKALGNLSLNPGIRDLILDGGAVPMLRALREDSTTLRKSTKVSHASIQARRKASRALAIMGINDRVCRLKGQRGIRILSLDGGGTRGLLSIQMLKRLKKLCGLEIYDMFDLVGGTSTGGIIAFLIGIKRLPIEMVERMYLELSGEIFGQEPHPVYSAGRMITTHGYYDAGVLERILQREIGFDALINTSEDPRACKTFALSALVSSYPETSFVFRNYQYARGVQSRYPGSFMTSLWEALRATSAAPTYFPELVLGDEIHSDGSLLANNPTAIAFHEARCLWGKSMPIECLLSVGTGTPVPRTSKFSGFLDMGRVLRSSATSTERTHELMTDIMPDGTYYRLNPTIADPKLADSLDEVRPEKMEEMRASADEYLDLPEVQQQLKAIARKLNPALRKTMPDPEDSSAGSDKKAPWDSVLRSFVF